MIRRMLANRLDDCCDKLVNLFGRRPTKRLGSSASSRFTLAKAASPRARQQVVGFSLLFDHRGGRLAVAADALVQVLAVSPCAGGGHQDIFGRHERQLFGQVPADDLRIDLEPCRHILVQDQQCVGGQEGLRQRQPAVCAVVERPLEPLRGGRCAALDSRLMTNRARPQILSARIGLRLYAIADEPIWSCSKGSSNSLRLCSSRQSVALSGQFARCPRAWP